MGSFAGKYSDNDQDPQGFEPFAAGVYELELVEGEVKPTSAGTGEIFKHKIRVIEGDNENRSFYGNMNLTNPNETAERIGRGEFKALRTVVGVLDIPDAELQEDDLLFKRFTGVVKVKPAKGDFEASNTVDWAKTLKLFKGELSPEKAAGTAVNDNKATANDNKPGATRPWKNRAAA